MRYFRTSTPRPTRLLAFSIDRFPPAPPPFFDPCILERHPPEKLAESVNQRYRIVGTGESTDRTHPPQPCVGNTAYISSVIDLSASRIAASTHRNAPSRYSNQFRLSPATCFLCIVIRNYIYTLYVYTRIRISISMHLLNGTSFPNSSSCVSTTISIKIDSYRVDTRVQDRDDDFSAREREREISAMFRITRSNLWLSLFVTRQGGEKPYSRNYIYI